MLFVKGRDMLIIVNVDKTTTNDIVENNQSSNIGMNPFLSGLHKIEIGLGTKFQYQFAAWFLCNFMLSGKA